MWNPCLLWFSRSRRFDIKCFCYFKEHINISFISYCKNAREFFAPFLVFLMIPRRAKIRKLFASHAEFVNFNNHFLKYIVDIFLFLVAGLRKKEGNHELEKTRWRFTMLPLMTFKLHIAECLLWTQKHIFLNRWSILAPSIKSPQNQKNGEGLSRICNVRKDNAWVFIGISRFKSPLVKRPIELNSRGLDRATKNPPRLAQGGKTQIRPITTHKSFREENTFAFALAFLCPSLIVERRFLLMFGGFLHCVFWNPPSFRVGFSRYWSKLAAYTWPIQHLE